MRDYHTGSIVVKLSAARRSHSSIIIPTIREALPTHQSYAFRDKEPRRNRCGLPYRKGKHLL